MLWGYVYLGPKFNIGPKGPILDQRDQVWGVKINFVTTRTLNSSVTPTQLLFLTGYLYFNIEGIGRCWGKDQSAGSRRCANIFVGLCL